MVWQRILTNPADRLHTGIIRGDVVRDSAGVGRQSLAADDGDRLGGGCGQNSNSGNRRNMFHHHWNFSFAISSAAHIASHSRVPPISSTSRR